MGKRKGKRKLTPEQRRQRRKRRHETMIIFINGKQKRVPRFSEPMVEGLPVDEFIRRNADDIWLTQNECYELLHERAVEREAERWRNEDSCLDGDTPPRPDFPDEYDPVGF
jgi:hypothetical protein